MKFKHFITAAIIAFAIAKAIGQKSPIEKVWYDQKKTCKVEIYTGPDGKYYGRMIWLNEPMDKTTGKPQTDKKNPDEKLRDVPLQGLVMLSGFTPDDKKKNVYSGGTVYDPETGKTYCGKITFKGKKLDMRGYLCSFSLFGKTEEWELAEGQ